MAHTEGTAKAGNAARVTPKREDTAAGLEALAALVRAHPEVPIPLVGSSERQPLTLYFLTSDPLGDMVAAARVLPGPFRALDTRNSRLTSMRYWQTRVGVLWVELAVFAPDGLDGFDLNEAVRGGGS